MPNSTRRSIACAFLVFIPLGLCVLLGFISTRPNVWAIHIANGPSPFSAGRLPSYYDEDPADQPQLLAADLGAIAGSYVVFVIFICILLLTVGRRLRRATQASPGTLSMEILKPVQVQPSGNNLWGPSPVSPDKSSIKWPSPMAPAGWGAAESSSRHNYHESVKSVATFDESVISEDRAKNEIEMDRLWKAVAEHESQRSSQGYPRSLTSDPPRSPHAQQIPELQHLRIAPPPEPISPTTTRYPINQQYQSYSAAPSAGAEIIQPPSRNSTKSPRRLAKPSPINTASTLPSRTSSRSSFASWAGRRKSPSIRDLPISPPMGSPDFQPNNHQHDESEPLTPRFMHPNAPPSAPAHRETFGSVDLDGSGRRFHFAPSIRSSRSEYSPAQTPRTTTFPMSPPPPIREQPSREEASANNHHGFSLVVDTASEHGSQAPSLSGKSSRSNKPKPLTLNSAGSSAGSKSSLSLRTAPLPFRALRSPNAQRPPSMIKATEIERPDKQAASRFLRSPGTAMPTTPYSPYMPQTPLTPMTPSRLVTREERRRMKKEEGRRVLTADDAVPEEDALWGDGYS